MFLESVQPCSSNLPHRSSQLHAPIPSLHRRFLRLTGRSKSQSQKSLRIFFSKNWFFRFLETQFGDLFASGSSNRKFYSERLATPVVTHSRVELPVAKNTLRQILKFCHMGFWRLALATYSRLNTVAKNACFAL